jgi:cell division ATPase FtsA
MKRFYGFDLGDAESCVSRLESDTKEDSAVRYGLPEILPVEGNKSFVTAYAFSASGQLLIGERACCEPRVSRRKIRFKSHFLTDRSVREDVRTFAAGVLGSLYGSGQLIQNEDACFYIGCPAGWDKNTREIYREIFEKCSFPPTRIISESRAALISACQSRHLQVGYDILSRPLLVVDIGSSTTDYAYIEGGHEVEMQTAGEVALGGGLMDEALLELCVQASPHAKQIREVFRQNEAWKNYCEFAARRLKEKYYSDTEYWKKNECADSIRILADAPVTLRLTIDESIARRLENGPVISLNGRSFCQVFCDSLKHVKEKIEDKSPELIFLTGGVSKMPSIREWCMNVFPDAIVISGNEPEFSVARGLAWSGKIDEQLRAFKADVKKLMDSDAVETIVEKHLDALYTCAVDSLVEPMVGHAAIPVFRKWRSGEIKRLADTDAAMQKEIAAYISSDEAHDLMQKVVARWLRPVGDDLEKYTQPICIRYGIPYTALSLSSYLTLSDMDIRLEARQLFAVDQVTLIIDSLITIITSLLCGGSGIALISSGFAGIAAGAILSVAILLLGRRQMEKQLLNLRLPKAVRKMVPESSLRSRLPQICDAVRQDLHERFETEKNEEITGRMVGEISAQIEDCLMKMAQIVEIPIG